MIFEMFSCLLPAGKWAPSKNAAEASVFSLFRLSLSPLSANQTLCICKKSVLITYATPDRYFPLHEIS